VGWGVSGRREGGQNAKRREEERDGEMVASMVACSVSAPVARLPTVRRARVSAPRTAGFVGMKGVDAKSAQALFRAPKTSEAAFARATAGVRGGRSTTTASIGAEIFGMILPMTGMTLLGLGLGFALLKLEATVEGEE